ncbi:MAG: PAS domain-containing protein [Planctomycetaceae bacterium]|nr:PAS domain-containing protein [Planctomycetales bacterium]MCB9939275.1 PAS domain-containing protein [Planctomycetaceae bacterium]
MSFSDYDNTAACPQPGDDILRLIKAAVEHVSHSVVITTAELDAPGPHIVYVTPAFTRMTGYARDELIGKTPRMLQGPNTDRNLLARMRKQLTEGQSFGCELINYRKDRSEYLVELTLDPVRDSSHRITHWIAVQQDVTERRRAEETLAQAERLASIGAAMAGLSHESRNALQRIQASLDELEELGADRPELMTHIDGIRHSQDDLFQLYEEVREFAAPVRLEPRTCYLDNIVNDTWATLAIKREGRTIWFRVHGGNVDLQCEVDEFAMRQTLRNILENALAACADPVEIDVSFAEVSLDGKPALRISLRDNGPGLNEEQKRRIFDEFYTTKPEGTGLGMAIVRRFIEAHGGRVTVASDFRSGAEVIVTLPRVRRR